MSVSEYAVKSGELRATSRASNRVLAFLFEIGRYAAGMALTLAVMDVMALTTFASTPVKRLVFIGGWALLMAAVEEVRVKATDPQPSK